MVLELGDTSAATNQATGISCEVQFKTKVCVSVSLISLFCAMFSIMLLACRSRRAASLPRWSCRASFSFHFHFYVLEVLDSPTDRIAPSIPFFLLGRLSKRNETSSLTRYSSRLTFVDLMMKQGMFSGTYNAIGGKVRKGSTDIGEVSGLWNQSMMYKSKVRTSYYAYASFPIGDHS